MFIIIPNCILQVITMSTTLGAKPHRQKTRTPRRTLHLFSHTGLMHVLPERPRDRFSTPALVPNQIVVNLQVHLVF